MIRLATLVTALLCAAPARAEGVITYDFDGDFDAATFAVENAIIGRGLNIAFIAHGGDMLRRAAEDLGTAPPTLDNTDVFLFCSAALSLKMLAADPENVAYCPYAIFVADHAGAVTIGFRAFPDGPMQEVQSLLSDIASEAAAD